MPHCCEGVIDGVKIVVVLEQNKLLAVYARPADARLWLGDVVTAKVARYALAQRAFFVTIGKDNALLPMADETKLSVGQNVMVRVARPATRQKAPRVELVGEEPAPGPDLLALAQQDFPDLKQGGNFDDIAHLLADFLQPTVTIQNGLNIVIEETAALVAIDINNADPNLSPLQANQLAATEIMHQLRLRNLGGQILIDFLRLRDPKQRTAVTDALTTLAATDSAKIDLYGFTRLGLFELTRARQGLSLTEVFALAANR